jgi:hypothetical protein
MLSSCMSEKRMMYYIGKQSVQFQTEDMLWSKVMPFYDFLKSKNEDPQTIPKYQKSLLLFIEFYLVYTVSIQMTTQSMID